MSHIHPKSREKLMIPSSIEDYVSVDNLVRFIDIIVDKIVQIQSEIVSGKGTNDTW